MKVYIVDDEESIRKIVQMRLSREGFETLTAESADHFAELWEKGAHAPLVITDLKMPGHDGFWLMKWVHEKAPETKCIVITGHGEKEVAIQALKLGAVDYLEKPFDLDELVHSVRRCERETRHEEERKDFLARLEARVERLEKPTLSEDWFTSKSASMKEVNRWLSVLEREARQSPGAEEPAVLILGENGTGKEGIARNVHAASARAKGPWVAVNCANFSDQLLESELFGHEKGAFTGAVAQKRGLFEQAHKGTLFLDEIGEMPGALQAKLLRVLQERTLRRVGGLADVKVDVRVVSATNVDIERKIQKGEFREDLYHRLNRVVLKLPPLRERADESVEMAKFFFTRAFESRGKRFSGFTAEAAQAVLAYKWPGNVRELQNAAERAALLSTDSGKIDPSFIPAATKRAGGEPMPETDPAVDLPLAPSGEGEANFSELRKRALAAFESKVAQQALNASNGNATQAAKALGIDRSNFMRLVKKYGLSSA